MYDWDVHVVGIQDISKRSTLPKVLARVEEKFRLDLNGDAAFIILGKTLLTYSFVLLQTNRLSSFSCQW